MNGYRHKRIRASIGWALSLAILAFPIGFVLAAIAVVIGVRLFRVLLFTLGAYDEDLYEMLTFLSAAFVPLTTAYAAARIVYVTMRWQYDDNDHPCRSCGYNLTGNVTGRCPECGADASNKCAANQKPTADS